LRVYTIDHAAGWDDMNLGSGGPVLLQDLGLVAGAGKDGILFVVKSNEMSKTRPADLDHPAANYAKLAAPPIWFTYFPGPGISAMPDDISTLNRLFLERTHHQHAAPVYWHSREHGPMLFCWGENGNLRARSVGANGAVRYLARGVEVASARSPVPQRGMTGLGTFGDGSKQLRVLWDSQDWNLHFSFCKLTPPVVANGKLYVPTYDARIDVYGLA
jgi:hypothetical protein